MKTKTKVKICFSILRKKYVKKLYEARSKTTENAKIRCPEYLLTVIQATFLHYKDTWSYRPGTSEKSKAKIHSTKAP